MIYARHLRLLVIRPTLRRMGMWSPAAENLLMGTAAKESHLGSWLKQTGGGPALGIYQIEPATAADIIHRYLDSRPDIEDQVEAGFQLVNTFDIDWGEVALDRISEKLIVDLAFSTSVARVRYWMVPEPLPNAGDVPGLADYWKRHYNTEFGAGTAEQFVNDYRITHQ